MFEKQYILIVLGCISLFTSGATYSRDVVSFEVADNDLFSTIDRKVHGYAVENKSSVIIEHKNRKSQIRIAIPKPDAGRVNPWLMIPPPRLGDESLVATTPLSHIEYRLFHFEIQNKMIRGHGNSWPVGDLSKLKRWIVENLGKSEKVVICVSINHSQKVEEFWSTLTFFSHISGDRLMILPISDQ
jgi:hypothetical protein